jgi:hypothetical protein
MGLEARSAMHKNCAGKSLASLQASQLENTPRLCGAISADMLVNR